MKKLFTCFILLTLIINLSACTISEEYYLPEKQEEENKPLTTQTSAQSDFNETFDTVKDRCNGFNIVNGLLFIDMSKKLYMYDPDNGSQVILCPDPSCSHNNCLWGLDSDACHLTPVQEIVTYGDKVFFIRVVAKNRPVKLDNGTHAIYDYQIISADFNGENIKKHHQTYDYIIYIYPADEEYMYFYQRDSYDGTYGLYKLTYKNNNIELLKTYVTSPNPICEKDGYLYYNDEQIGYIGRLNLETLEDEVVCQSSGINLHYDDTYIYFQSKTGKGSNDFSIFRYTFETGSLDEIVSGTSRYRISDQHIFFTKDEGLKFEGTERDHFDRLSGRIYMCDKDGSNIVLLRDDYEKIYYSSFYMYKDKLYAEFFYYDENLVDNIENRNKYLYGYVTIGDMESDFTTFDVKSINE